MTTDLERRLREALHDDAQRARLINPDRPPVPDVLVLSDAPHRSRSGRRLAAVAASVALIAGAGVVLVQNARDRTPEVPTSPNPTQLPDSTVPLLPAPIDRQVDRSPAPDVTTSPDSTQLFTDIPPGSTVPLPPAPIAAVEIPAAVWTDTEIIVWGGIEARTATVGDGVAFNLATGSWRVIAPAPIQGRAFAKVAWTGTEMIVWGGRYRDGTLTDDGSYNQTYLADGAAYDPTTDTWRLLPEAPIDPALEPNAVWTGDELIVLGGGKGNQAAAYDPTTNEWRRLADALEVGAIAGASRSVFTGTTILTSIQVSPEPGSEPNATMLARYDLSADTWHLDEDARYAALVGIPDDDGVTRTVIGLPVDTGAPVEVLDAVGNPVARLPGTPVDVDEFGDRVEVLAGMWVGDEALFWFTNPEWGAGFGAPAGQGEEAWALNPATQTWRMLPAGAELIDPELAIGDVLFASVSPDGAAPRPVLYRVPRLESLPVSEGDGG